MSILPISLPISRLATDPEQRRAQLRHYFCDKDAVAFDHGDRWLLTLNWSDDADRYVDPNLDEGLMWWGGITYRQMSTARERYGRLLLTLNDTWTLESWSHWLRKHDGQADVSVVLLHVDDHKDIGSPRLFAQEQGWYDPIAREKVELDCPDSVRRAIESGALGMGSFMTPFLHYAPATEVRHLCQAPKCFATKDSFIHRVSANDTLLAPSQTRPAIELVQDSQGVGAGRYRFTNDLEMWLEGVATSGKEVLLHVDLDYFCNRYDGDSDLVDEPGPLDVPLEQILLRIDELSSALKRHGLTEGIADISIAFSPGFFPAEFWAPACERLLNGLGECHVAIAKN